jgi:hypothetical protein
MDSRTPSPEQIPHHRNQPGESVIRVNVFLNDVEREIIKPAETPNDRREQERDFPGRIVATDQDGGGDADEQEQQSLRLDPNRIWQVFHDVNYARQASSLSLIQDSVQAA